MTSGGGLRNGRQATPRRLQGQSRAAVPRHRRRFRRTHELRNRLQHGRHFLMDQVDCLEGAYQHFDLDDLALVVPLEQVDSVDADAVNLDLELQCRVARTSDFPDVSEGFVGEYVERGVEVLQRNRLSCLRSMDYRRVKNDILCEKRSEALRVSRMHNSTPSSERIQCHR